MALKAMKFTSGGGSKNKPLSYRATIKDESTFNGQYNRFDLVEPLENPTLEWSINNEVRANASVHYFLEDNVKKDAYDSTFSGTRTGSLKITGTVIAIMYYLGSTDYSNDRASGWLKVYA